MSDYEERCGEFPLWQLGQTKDGSPEHPLMVPYARTRQEAW